MSKKTELKRELILAKAKEVFIRKGFGRTTMKDIVDECEISRGGIYLYFSSTDEIFVEVVKKHNRAKMQFLNEKIKKSTDFTQLIDEFFAEQKEHLLNMENSLFAAMTEFCFEHKSSSDKDFYTEQFFNTKKLILELLKFGKAENAVKSKDIDRLADSIMFLIEGLRSLAVSGNISEKIADEQIKVCRNMVLCN